MNFRPIYARKRETTSAVGCLLIAGIILVGVVLQLPGRGKPSRAMRLLQTRSGTESGPE